MKSAIRILDRYIFFRFMKTFWVSLGLILCIFIVFDIKEKITSGKKELENKKKQQLIYFTIAGIIGLLFLSGFIYKSYLDKKKINMMLQQKIEIIEQNLKIIEAQKNEITDSIRYARRLQEAILPPDNLWFHIFPQSFILYLPKDILSGDFY